MGDIRGFIKIKRENAEYRPVCERVKDYREVVNPRSDRQSREQASRCMDCGVPFCHFGCPIANFIPEWNDLIFNEQWERAYELLNATNILPEVTGRVCPALCEFACVLGINDDPVTIRENELAIAEHAFKNDWIKPNPPQKRTGKKVAVVGSGPAGLACAVQLNRLGYAVTVFERDEKIGGIMRFGIPEFKLDKSVLDRRIAIWEKEGIMFKTGVNVGINYPSEMLKQKYDAVCVAGGSRVPRDLKIEGRELKGIYFAMDYLIQSNRHLAKGKKVVVIGGGDTGADCVGTANRQGAACVVQIELLPKPPVCRDETCLWPRCPLLLKTTSSHEEGANRQWSILTKKFVGDENGQVKALSCIGPKGSLEIEAELVIIAVGFLHPEHNGIISDLKVELDNRGNVKTGPDYMTLLCGVFCAGDMRRGQSLIVWAIYEGLQAAAAMDRYLKNKK